MRHSLRITAVLLALAGTAAALQERPRPRPGEDDQARFFAVPMVRETRELADLVQEHLDAGRNTEAMDLLQRMLDEHAGEVLPDEGLTGSQFPHYPGVSEWALARMFELPPETHALYRARYGVRAANSLQNARKSGDRRLLIAVQRRFPLAPAALEAWISLGDLEFEAGERATAHLAWTQAAALAARLALPAPALGSRLERAVAPARPAAGGALPRRDAEPWRTPLDLAPFGPRGGSPLRNNLFPLVAGERLFVSSTLRLFALDAFTGGLAWQAGPPRGWAELGARAGEELFVGLNGQLALAPAAGSGVVVAALQLPFSEFESDGWQGIEIMKAIPERRLFAFDLESGRELWNHAPRFTFDGLAQRWDGGGTYAQRMMVAGAPVVAGARVLVPCYRMQGRIDYHVACYELATGELLWSTPVISGQRERNMFGRSQAEFCASPLVVAGARVVAQTELGTIAALDLFSGRILWESTYRQIALPKTRVYTPQPRPITWRLAPPVVVGEVVVATPSDSNELNGLSLSDGKVLWAYSEDKLQDLDPETQQEGFNVLVGADADSVYLSGGKISALQKPGGLATTAPFLPRWTNVLGRVDSSPRALLAGDVLVAPSGIARTVFERRSGERIEALSGDWNSGEAGNLCVAEGALFSLSATGVSGYFDWQTLLERARLAARETRDGETLARAAELFLRRGRLLLEGGENDAARAVLSEASSWFAALRAAGGTNANELACALALAEALAATGRERSALETLAAAHALAPAGNAEAEVLFLEERVLHAAGGAERVARLDQLAERHAHRPLPAPNARTAVDEWLAGHVPPAGALAPIPTFAWARVERAGERVRAGDLAGALQDLHEVLATVPPVGLARGVELSDVVRERIGRLLLLPGGAEAHAPYQAQAEQALAGAGTDDAGLLRVQALFPHSRAAEQVLALRLERAVAARDPAAVAELIAATMARPALSEARAEELYLELARLLAEFGNPEYERGLLAALARRAPARRSPLSAHEGRTFAELASASPSEAPAAPRGARFTQSVVSAGKVREGPHQFLGTLTPGGPIEESSPRALALYAAREGLVAFDANAPGRPAWSAPLELGGERGAARAVFPSGAVVVAARERLLCLDSAGNEAWSRALGEGTPQSLALASGVVLGLGRDGGARAFDARLGLPLWTVELDERAGWTGPLVGESQAVFLAQSGAEAPRVLVLDLYTGRARADFRLPSGAWKAGLEASTWLSAGRLIVPSFAGRAPSSAGLSAFDLDDGRRAWTIPLPLAEELHALARHGDDTYALTLGATLGTGGANGGVYLLDEQSGSLRRIAPLKAGEKWMGIEAAGLVELAEPWLFAYGLSETGPERGVQIRALHLPGGVAWSWTLPVAQNEFYDGRELAMPAVSESTVALAMPIRRSNGSPLETVLVFLDKRVGRKLDLRALGGPLASTRRLELRGLGDALFVQGWSATGRGSGLEILEALR